MKRIYMFLSAAAICACTLFSMSSPVSAQVQRSGGITPPSGSVPLSHMFHLHHPVNNSRSVTGNWLEYWFVEDSLAIVGGNSPGGAYTYLFPDSSVLGCDAGGCENPFVHLIGNILDPNSADLQNIEGYSWSNTNPYTVDSVSINYSYSRSSDPSIVDTLVVYLWNNAVSTDIDTRYYFPFGNSSPYSSDTVMFGLLSYDSVNTSLNMPNVSSGALHIFKALLTTADTAAPGINELTKVVNTLSFQAHAGQLVASAIGFIPGYSYNYPGDTITSQQNAFVFYSDQPNGANSYAPYTAGDWNCSSIIDNSNRYNEKQGWDGAFIPTYAFTDAYPLQEHEISYYVSGVFDVGIESNTPEGLKLYQNQPNPSNHSTNIRYETQTAGAIVLEVRDLTGRLVMELNQGTQSAGMHNAVIDISGLSQGMYLYTLKTDQGSITRRMVVSE